MGNICRRCLSACSILDETVDPGVPRKSPVRHHHRHKKRILCHWHRRHVHPGVASTEDHSENLARKRSSKDIPGVHVVDKDTEKNSDLKHLQQHMPGQTSSEEATGVHMMQVDPATLANVLTDTLQELSSDKGEKEDPEDVKKSSGVPPGECNEGLLCERPLKIPSERLSGSLKKRVHFEDEERGKGLLFERRLKIPSERFSGAVEKRVHFKEEGELEDLEEDVPGQTSPEEVIGVHMMPVDPVTLANVLTDILRELSSDEGEEDPEDVKKSSGVPPGERDEGLLCEHQLKIPSERFPYSLKKRVHFEDEGELEDLEEDVPGQTSPEEVIGVHMMQLDPATRANGELEDLEEDVPGQTSPEEVIGVHMMQVDPATRVNVLTDILQELSSDEGEKEDPEDVKKSSGVPPGECNEGLLCERPLKIPSERLSGSLKKRVHFEEEGELEDLEEDVPGQTSSEEATGVHMMQVDPATRANGHLLEERSSDSRKEEDPEDMKKSSGVPQKDPQEDLAVQYPHETPVERILPVINADTFTETNGDKELLEEDVPGQTSSEEATGVHMMRMDPATMLKFVPEHLQEWSSDSEDEEDPEDVEKSSGVPQKELGDSTITGSHQQMSASPSSAPAEEATEKTKVEEEVKTTKKTRKPRKNTWWNVLNCWDIFNRF
ncbi:protein FAM153B [Rhinopithecus roxellana]|uniref:protein FAM153B n=1 Tax=Rhinopithecus roxellana TaxID=61622 RepID=UPI00123751E6|nr:protein FAM153B [Rhinopithecus roxellana]